MAHSVKTYTTPNWVKPKQQHHLLNLGVLSAVWFPPGAGNGVLSLSYAACYQDEIAAPVDSSFHIDRTASEIELRYIY